MMKPLVLNLRDADTSYSGDASSSDEADDDDENGSSFKACIIRSMFMAFHNFVNGCSAVLPGAMAAVWNRATPDVLTAHGFAMPDSQQW